MLKFAGHLFLAAMALCTSARATTTDNFFADSTLSSKWVVASGNAASTIKVIPTLGLLMTASASNGGSDLYSGSNYNAPMVFQNIQSSANWTSTVSLAFNDCVCYYTGAGIILATQPGKFTEMKQFLRVIERGQLSSATSLSGDTLRADLYGANATISLINDVVLLRVQKAGQNYTASYSLDGLTFTTLSKFTDSREFTYIGLETIHQPYDGNTAINEQALFSDFEFFPQ